MRKKLCLLALALALLALASCGGKQADTPNTDSAAAPEAPAAPPAPSGEEPVFAADPMLAAYTDVLEGVYFDHVFPAGQDLGLAEGSSEDGNQFAIFDVDQDGQDELIISYTTTYTAGMTEFVLGFDEASGAVTQEFAQFPLVTYYDNGIIQAGWSHSQGKAGDALWPYTFWRYDPQTDTYEGVEMVDAWDKKLVEDGFPEDVDKDGDGVVYYFAQYGNYDQSDPVDNDAYEQWRDSFVGGAEELRIPYMTLNEENIKSIQ